MGRLANSLNRPSPRFKPQPTILVICEDSKSGKRYLEDSSRHFKVEVKVEITHCGHTDPQGIVAEALERQQRFDHVFCVIDRDGHQKFDEALAAAKHSHKVDVIASYPCFEFWLLLHFENSRKPYTAAGKKSAADRLIAHLQTYPEMKHYAKGDAQSLFAALKGDRFATARAIAPGILGDALKCGNMNPSTRLHELMDFFEKLSVPQLVK